MKPRIVVTILLGWIVGLALSPPSKSCSAAESAWKAGVARTCITPDGSYWMAGYASRNRPSEGTLQDLYAKAIAIDDAKGSRIVIVTMDILVVTKDLAAAVARRSKEKYGLPRSRLLLNCSHTHCGPEIRLYRESLHNIPDVYAKKMRKYVKNLEENLVDIIGDAIDNQRPVRLSVNQTTASFAVNRRNNRESDVPKLRKDGKLKGPVDHAVPVMQVTDADGKIMAVLFGYACHNTTLGIYETNGDYAGFAQHYIEDKHPGSQAMFVMGAGGDQNPLPRRRIKYVRQHGQALAMAVEQALTTSGRRAVP